MHCHACRDVRRAITTLLLRQLQHATVPAELQLHYYDVNYNMLLCPGCYYYTTTTTTTTRCHACHATIKLLLLELQTQSCLP